MINENDEHQRKVNLGIIFMTANKIAMTLIEITFFINSCTNEAWRKSLIIV